MSALVAMTGTAPRRSRVRAAIWIAGAVAVIVGVLASRPNPPAPPRVVRTTIAADLYYSATDRDFTFTPDGSRLAYISRDGTQILIRAMDTLDPVPILTTAAHMRGPFASPDGRWIGFVENAFWLRKIPSSGGPTRTVVQMDGPSRGAAWSSDDTIRLCDGREGDGPSGGVGERWACHSADST